MTNAKGSTAGRGVAQSLQRAEAALAETILTLGIASFAVFASRTSTGGMAMTSACVMFAALFGPYCGLSVSSWTASLSAWLGRAPGLRCSLVWIISVGIVASYSWFMNAPLSVFLLVRFAAYGLLPILLVFAGRGRASAGSTGDGRVLLALAAIWLPSEFRLVAGVHLPAGAPGGVDAARLAIVDLALVLFLAARPLPAIGYTFRIG